jgi:predicted transcriptional regulator
MLLIEQFHGPTGSYLDEPCSSFLSRNNQPMVVSSKIAVPLLQKTTYPCTVIITDTTTMEQKALIKALGGDLVFSDKPLEMGMKISKQQKSLLVFKLEPIDFAFLFNDVKGTVILYSDDLDEMKVILKGRDLVNPEINVIFATLKDVATFDNCQVVKVSELDAIKCARKAISNKLLVGIHSGAVLMVARDISGDVTAYLPDSLDSSSKILLNDEWLIEHQMISPKLDFSKYRGASVDDLQLPEATFVFDSDTVASALLLMENRDFSILPVTNSKRKMIGLVTKDSLQKLSCSKDLISEQMCKFPKGKNYTIVTPDTLLEDLESMFEKCMAVFVTDTSGKFPLAVVTKYDLIKFIERRGF